MPILKVYLIDWIDPEIHPSTGIPFIAITDNGIPILIVGTEVRVDRLGKNFFR